MYFQLILITKSICRNPPSPGRNPHRGVLKASWSQQIQQLLQPTRESTDQRIASLWAAILANGCNHASPIGTHHSGKFVRCWTADSGTTKVWPARAPPVLFLLTIGNCDQSGVTTVCPSSCSTEARSQQWWRFQCQFAGLLHEAKNVKHELFAQSARWWHVHSLAIEKVSTKCVHQEEVQKFETDAMITIIWVMLNILTLI